jgi:hypothetical protein
MAAPRYSRIDAPEMSQSEPTYFNQLSGFSNTLSGESLSTTTSSNYKVLRQPATSPLSGTTHGQNSMISPEICLPSYRDYSDSPIPILESTREYNSRALRGSQLTWRPGRRDTNQSWRSRTSTLASKLKDYGVSSFTVPRIASPWDHEAPRKGMPPDYHTVKEFDYRLQRRRLFTNSAFQWGVTFFLCGALAGTLRSFQYYFASGMGQNQKHAFNGLITGLSIALGINLASSLRGYAEMMRWRFLASAYRSVQEFELVMQCQSQMKVLRLLWTARTRGRMLVPNQTQILCFIWISVNVLLQVLVALLGLTYSIDTSSTWVSTQSGNVSVCDLSLIRDINNDTITDYYTQIAAANLYGISGQDYLIYPNISDDALSQTYTNAIYTDNSHSYMEYRFDDLNPNDESLDVISWRTINATAHCEAYKVVAGATLNSTNTTYVEKNGDLVTVWIQPVTPGFTTWMSNTKSDCGPRCTEVWVLQAADGVTVIDSMLFKCNNTVNLVIDSSGDYPVVAAAPLQMPDEQAQIIAGAIGWSGFYYNFTPFEFVRYSQATVWSPSFALDAPTVASDLEEFSMVAVAAMDDHGPRTIVTGDTPVPAQVVNVQWEWSVIILAVIPAIQMLALLAIIAWANKAIIKDNSFLGISRLLRPLVDKLGPHGCMLTGDQIAEELANVKVAYGYRSPPGFIEGSDMVRHIDILQEHEGLGLSRAFPAGRYDGDLSAGGAKSRKRRMSI